MLSIGLTGGIGSGKTTVAAIFETLGIPVYYADDAAKKIMNENENVKAAIEKNFGTEAFINGKLNRKYLADIVFTNAEKITLLNFIVHPATIKNANDWIKNQRSPYVIKEAALIFESGSNKNLDYVIGVKSPESLRILRTMKRNNVTYEDVAARSGKQMKEEEKLGLCDFILTNDEEELLLPQVLQLHDHLLRLSKR